MSTLRIKEETKDFPHFLTLTVHGWYYVFDRHNRFEILANSLHHCQKHKQLQIFAFVFMLNHVHLIAAAPDLIGVIRDFKSFTSKELSKNICATEPNILKLFETEKGFQFWQPGNEPKTLESDDFFEQKYNYIHENPVRKQYVDKEEYWKWSSANPDQSIIEVSSITELNTFNRDD